MTRRHAAVALAVLGVATVLAASAAVAAFRVPPSSSRTRCTRSRCTAGGAGSSPRGACRPIATAAAPTVRAQRGRRPPDGSGRVGGLTPVMAASCRKRDDSRGHLDVPFDPRYGRCMPRPPRFEMAGCLYHVTTRSASRRSILPDAGAREELIRLVGATSRRHQWNCHAYCVMTTHYHLLVTIREETLSRGMQWLNGLYGAWFNETRAGHGHVFGARFKSVPIMSDAHLLWLVSYIAMNPDEARARIERFVIPDEVVP